MLEYNKHVKLGKCKKHNHSKVEGGSQFKHSTKFIGTLKTLFLKKKLFIKLFDIFRFRFQIIKHSRRGFKT